MSLFTFTMKTLCGWGDNKRDAGIIPPENIETIADISYGPHKDNVLDLYLPTDVEGMLPVIVSVHGGAWIYGSKERYKPYCMDLARRGFAVVNFTYRLSPKHRHPAHLEDTDMAFRWVQENCAKYRMDMTKLFAVGDSAGGHLLSLYCCLCVNPEYASKYPFGARHRPLPKAVALNCGLYDVELEKENKLLGESFLSKNVLPKGGMEQAKLDQISPILHTAPGFPPSYIMTSNDDFLQNHAEPFCNKLRSHHVPCIYKKYGTDELKLGHVFHLDIRSKSAIECNDAECDFFRSYF